MNIEKTVRDYLPQVIHLSLATCAADKPWVCEVHYTYDDELNLYFRSKPQRRHSIEIETNPHVAGNMVTQHFLNQKVRGVYFEGTAECLTGVDANHPSYTTWCERFGGDESLLEEAKEETGHHFYKITVNNFVVFDGYDGPSAKHELVWK